MPPDVPEAALQRRMDAGECCAGLGYAGTRGGGSASLLYARLEAALAGGMCKGVPRRRRRG